MSLPPNDSGVKAEPTPAVRVLMAQHRDLTQLRLKITRDLEEVERRLRVTSAP